MAITTNKALLFLAGGCAAALAIAYASGALDPLFREPPKPIVALPEPAEMAPKDGRLPTPESPATASPDAPEAPAEAAAASEEQPVVTAPSFDVMRVEGDGSIVIAGKATPGSKVEILVGSNVVAQATTGPEGDFAAVLEEPMKPGDYQIVLRSTSPRNVVAMSVETAVVSIPQTADGQVLALVEKPGKPSEMIILPKPKAPSDDTAGAAPAAPEPAVEKPAIAPQGAEAPAVETPDAAKTTEDQLQAALPPVAAPADTPAAVPVAPATPGAEGPRVMVEAVEIDGRKIFVAGAADAGRRVRGYANEILLGDATTSPDGRYLIEAERDVPVGDYIIRVDALGPDGVKVAARAAVPFEREPGETIAAVAPQAPAAPTLVVPAQPAAVAPAAPDVAATVATDGDETPPAEVAQAPADEAAAAPTAPAAMADQTSGDTAPTASAAPDASQTPAPPSQAPAKPAVVAEAPAAAAVETPAPEAAKAGKPAPEAATAPIAQAPAAGAESSAKAPAPETPAKTPEMVAEAPASAAPAASASAGETAAAPDEASAAATQAPASPVMETPAAGNAEAEQQAGTDIAMAPAPGDDLAAPPDAGVPEVLAPKLQNVDSAVIIRRGDTLWRLSYRVYGRGVRYSTIYLANQSQIEDPDRIWPGQVFKLPEKSSDGKAQADLERLGDRATTVPK